MPSYPHKFSNFKDSENFLAVEMSITFGFWRLVPLLSWLSTILIQAGCDIILPIHHSHPVSTGYHHFHVAPLLHSWNVSSGVHLTGLINAGCDNTIALQHPTLTASSSAWNPQKIQNQPPKTNMPCHSFDDFSWPLAKDRVARRLIHISLPMSFTASQVYQLSDNKLPKSKCQFLFTIYL